MSQSSKAWLNRHVNDPFVKQATREGYRSRATYKLQEIAVRDKLFRPGMIVVDLGAAPGGWSQLAAQAVVKKVSGQVVGTVIAIDLLPVEPIPGVQIIEDDFTTDQGLAKVNELVNGKLVDLVFSDMAPNISGIRLADQARQYNLCELALEFAAKTLKHDGSFVVKAFQGPGFQEFVLLMRENFVTVATRKPKASRGESSECFLIGRGLKNATEKVAENDEKSSK